MSLREQQNLLAKLYTDERLRRAFLSAPHETGAEFHLTDGEIDDLAAVMPEELEFFAESLFWKRLREAEKFTPLLKKLLKDEFAAFFREFSAGFNPQSIKKHFEDALGFCRYLQTRNVSLIVLNVARYDESRLAFHGFERRFAVRVLDFDVKLLNDENATVALDKLKKRKKIAVWMRRGKRIRHFFI